MLIDIYISLLSPVMFCLVDLPQMQDMSHGFENARQAPSLHDALMVQKDSDICTPPNR